MSLCPPCQELWDGWTMYLHGQPATKWIQYQGIRQSLESRRNQLEERRQLINRQCAAIREACLRKHQIIELEEAA